MEAKDTVMPRVNLFRGSTPLTVEQAEKLLKEQAEISFEAGEQNSDKKWRQILRDSVYVAELKGVRKAAEQLETWRNQGTHLVSDEAIKGLKVWRINEDNPHR